MDANVVNQFLVTNAKDFPEEQIPFLKQKLLDASDDKLTLVQCTEFKDPTTILIISILIGEGTVLSVREMGADTLYEIAFDRVGTKKLMATYAKLRKI